MSIPVINLVTAHGRQALSGHPRDTVADVLARHGIPWSGVSVYATEAPGSVGEQRACLTSQLRDLGGVAELNLYLNRNVNPLMFSLAAAAAAPSDGAPITEYAYQRLGSADDEPRTLFRELSSAECQAIVADRVAECLTEHVPAGSTIVLGVSGGGDSNALLHALSQCQALDLTVVPVMLQGIPDWDAGLDRALELCRRYGLELEVVDERAVAALLGLETDGRSLVDRFESAFPGDDFEFLGTLLIRLALSRRARELATPYLCTGLNFEDVLCEGLYRLARGLGPAQMPARKIGDHTLLLPLWRCPKRILDGCFPRFSLANYEARFPCFSLGRNQYYSVAYALQSQFPGYVEQLVSGLAELAAANPPHYGYDPELGFEVERAVPLRLRRAFSRMRRATPA